MAQKAKANIWGVRSRPKLALTYPEAWFEEDELGSERCYRPFLKSQRWAEVGLGFLPGYTGLQRGLRTHREEGLDKMKGRGQGQRAEWDRIQTRWQLCP